MPVLGAAQNADLWLRAQTAGDFSRGCCSSTNSATKSGLVLCIVGIFGCNLVPSESLGFVASGFRHWQHLSKSSGCSLRIKNAGQGFGMGKKTQHKCETPTSPP